MNDRRNWVYIALIAIGLLFLSQNLGFMPGPMVRSLKVLWPLALIALGVYLLVAFQDRDLNVSWSGSEGDPVELRVGEKSYRIEDPIVRTIFGIDGAIVGITVAGLVLFGVVGPILLVVLAVVGIVLVIALGIPFLALLIPLFVLASPIILLIWLLRLLF